MCGEKYLLGGTSSAQFSMGTQQSAQIVDLASKDTLFPSTGKDRVWHIVVWLVNDKAMVW